MPEMPHEQMPSDGEPMRAQEAVRQAEEIVAAELGKVVVEDAEALMAADAEAPQIADEAVPYMKIHSLDPSVTAEAERVITMKNTFDTVSKYGRDLKHPDYKDKF